MCPAGASSEGRRGRKGGTALSIRVDEGSLKQGLLGLVVALVEVIRDALELEALRQIDAGMLSDEAADRLGKALLDMHEALEAIKAEHGIAGVVRQVRDGLDDVVDDVVHAVVPAAER